MSEQQQEIKLVNPTNPANAPDGGASQPKGVSRAVRAMGFANVMGHRLHLPVASYVVYVMALAVGLFMIWASIFELDEVSTGGGKVVPTLREQVIQSLEGGILSDLRVHEGDIVDAGQVLAQLDRTRVESTVGESESRLRAALATAARLRAELNNVPLVFPPLVRENPELVKSETSYFHSRRQSLEDSLAGLNKTLAIIRNELELTEPLAAKGAASQVEVLRLRRQISEMEVKKTEISTQYRVKAREELAKAEAEIEAQQSITRGREDTLGRLTLTAPVRGIVKSVQVTTVGGVVPPNGNVMSIVPLEDKLLIEARISPRDIAFIHPGQSATVKITAYDFAIYGGLPGQVTIISPDTIQDEVKRDNYYYRVFVRTDDDRLRNKAGKEFPIFPGMIATVDIHTGSKSIMSYLVKPFNRAREALRER